MKAIEQAILALDKELAEAEVRYDALAHARDVLKELLPADGHKAHRSKTKASARKKPAAAKRKSSKSPTTKQDGGPKGKASQYVGVGPGKLRKDGTSPWKANAYVGGKVVWCGQYEIEEMAAAAVQEKLGNQDEAQRLRGLAEHKVERDEPENPSTKVIAWECKCLWRSQGETKPDKCARCGKEALAAVKA